MNAECEQLSSEFQICDDDDSVFDVGILKSDLNNVYEKIMKDKSSLPKSLEDLKCLKSADDANKFRNEGNIKLTEHGSIKPENLYQALSLYTMSVALAPVDGEELAMAYAERSNALFQLKKYKPCLLDINRGLNGKCPQNMRKQLRDRKGKCLKYMNVTNKKFHSIEGATDPDELKTSANEETLKSRPSYNFDNALLPNTSSKIKLECNKQWGRYMVATEDIKPGEILSSEKFFALELAHERLQSGCSYCLSECYALIPCPNCIQAMYCSRNCREIAYNLYHRTECKILPFYNYEDENSRKVIMAIRIFLIGTKQGTELLEMEKLIMNNIFQEKVDPSSTPFVINYLSSLKLCRTFDVSQIQENILAAIKVTILLQRLSFFETNSGGQHEDRNDLNDVELFATCLLLNHLVALKTNTFIIGGILDILVDMVEAQMGKGILILHNMINHSCNPNIYDFIQNQEHFLFATRPIKAGEQLFLSYTYGVFAYSPIQERMKKFHEYGFKCQCEACVGEWPLLKDLKNCKIEFSTKDKNKVFKSLEEMINPIIQMGTNKMKEREKISEMLIEILICVYDNVKTPSVATVECEVLLAKYMKLFSDDYYGRYIRGILKKEDLEQTLKIILNNVKT